MMRRVGDCATNNARYLYALIMRCALLQNGSHAAVLLAQRLAPSLMHLDQNASSKSRDGAVAALALLIEDFPSIFRTSLAGQTLVSKTGSVTRTQAPRPSSAKVSTRPMPLANLLTSVHVTEGVPQPCTADVSNHGKGSGVRGAVSAAKNQANDARIMHAPNVAPAALARIVSTGAACPVTILD
jgi:hypothetical protein